MVKARSRATDVDTGPCRRLLVIAAVWALLEPLCYVAHQVATCRTPCHQ